LLIWVVVRTLQDQRSATLGELKLVVSKAPVG